jgi:hypothetical protein
MLPGRKINPFHPYQFHPCKLPSAAFLIGGSFLESGLDKRKPKGENNAVTDTGGE